MYLSLYIYTHTYMVCVCIYHGKQNHHKQSQKTNWEEISFYKELISLMEKKSTRKSYYPTEIYKENTVLSKIKHSY